MKKMIFKILALIITLVILYFLVVILLGVFTQYQPEVETKIEHSPTQKAPELNKDTLVFYTWNIGYAGLDKKSDFFYDGGKMVRPPKDRVRASMNGILSEINSWKDADFIYLQEVDVHSKRSYHIPEMQEIIDGQKDFPISVFGLNYQVKFVPKPFLEPMGEVKSGILMFSKYHITESLRMSYPGEFPFPVGVFFLNRCFTISRMPYHDKEVILINTHNSAFDGGVLKTQEMEFLKSYLTREYAKGNYVIAGGDWNQVYPGFPKSDIAQYEESPVPDNFPEIGWKWIVDQHKRTNRKVDTPFIKGVTYSTSFDFFLVSPNVEALSVEVLVRDFEYSDHEPVKMKVKLME